MEIDVVCVVTGVKSSSDPINDREVGPWIVVRSTKAGHNVCRVTEEVKVFDPRCRVSVE